MNFVLLLTSHALTLKGWEDGYYDTENYNAYCFPCNYIYLGFAKLKSFFTKIRLRYQGQRIYNNTHNNTKNTVYELYHKWATENKHKLKNLMLKITNFEPFLTSYISQIEFYRLLFVLDGFNFAYNEQKIQLYYKHIPEFFPFYYEMLRHKHLQVLLDECMETKGKSPSFESYNDIKDYIINSDGLSGYELERAFVSIRKNLRDLIVKNLENQIKATCCIPGYHEKIEDNLMFAAVLKDDAFTGLKTLTEKAPNFLNFDVLKKINLHFAKICCSEGQRLNHVDSNIILNAEAQKRAQTILLSLDGIYFPEYYKIVNIENCGSIGPKILGFANINKLVSDIKSFLKNFDAHINDLTKLNILPEVGLKIADQEIHNLEKLTEMTFHACIEIANKVNLYLTMLVFDAVKARNKSNEKTMHTHTFNSKKINKID